MSRRMKEPYMLELIRDMGFWVYLATQFAVAFFSFQFGWMARQFMEQRAKRAQRREGENGDEVQ